jgi:hypothetical protein
MPRRAYSDPKPGVSHDVRCTASTSPIFEQVLADRAHPPTSSATA